ncbi:MAG: hypothetical protein GWO20_00720 [Candidatus Korarchaeota archaeon]|nr:hypothetical protein [Candidatus Korarchaeota archaeon]NIU82104.1 hypothetical protein [Candidatus Thorarchaeota archaeon]NIW12515.1 hypothetical protein [Candidatus Thorarchaeota archaeon]NIW50734.1 hypothetical protein [Candidatus Korarchaeota archaeon]
MRRKDLKVTILTGVFLLLSLVSGGTAAIMTEGLVYDIMYAIHKITSVLVAIFFIVSIRSRGKGD